MIIETGEYVINFYNKYGSRLKDERMTSNGIIAARVSAEIGAGKIKDAKSYTIDRRIFNSIDKED